MKEGVKPSSQEKSFRTLLRHYGDFFINSARKTSEILEATRNNPAKPAPVVFREHLHKTDIPPSSREFFDELIAFYSEKPEEKNAPREEKKDVLTEAKLDIEELFRFNPAAVRVLYAMLYSSTADRLQRKFVSFNSLETLVRIFEEKLQENLVKRQKKSEGALTETEKEKTIQHYQAFREALREVSKTDVGFFGEMWFYSIFYPYNYGRYIAWHATSDFLTALHSKKPKTTPSRKI